MKEDFLHEAWLKIRYLFSRAADFVFPVNAVYAVKYLGFSIAVYFVPNVLSGIR